MPSPMLASRRAALVLLEGAGGAPAPFMMLQRVLQELACLLKPPAMLQMHAANVRGSSQQPQQHRSSTALAAGQWQQRQRGQLCAAAAEAEQHLAPLTDHPSSWRHQPGRSSRRCRRWAAAVALPAAASRQTASPACRMQSAAANTRQYSLPTSASRSRSCSGILLPTSRRCGLRAWTLQPFSGCLAAPWAAHHHPCHLCRRTGGAAEAGGAAARRRPHRAGPAGGHAAGFGAVALSQCFSLPAGSPQPGQPG